MPTCVIEGCQRQTKRSFFSAWICTRHWRAVPGPVKDRLAAAKKRYKRAAKLWRRIMREDFYSPKAYAAVGRNLLKCQERADAAWDACVLEATIADRMGAANPPRRGQ